VPPSNSSPFFITPVDCVRVVNVIERLVHDDEARELARLNRAELVGSADDFGAVEGRAAQHFIELRRGFAETTQKPDWSYGRGD
jgi:hypothetical protein